MKLDQGASFAQFLAPASAQGAHKPAKGGRVVYYLLAVGAVVVAALFAFLYSQFQQAKMESKSVQAKLAAFQRDKEAAEEKLADITKQEEAQKALEEMFGKQAEEATTQEAKATAQRELETIRQKTKELARQRAEALKERQRLAQQAQTMHAPAAPVQPVQPPLPAPAAPAPAPGAAAQDVQPTVTHQGSPLIPRVARESLPPGLQNVEIRVALKVFVNAAGRPLKVVILKGVDGPPDFNEAAQNAALASTYAPGLKDGKPASGWLNMEFNFGRAR
jgi:cell division protein FtsN